MTSIIGVGLTRLGRHQRSATALMQEALERALGDSRLPLDEIKGLIAVPSLSEPRFMQAHYLATRVGLLPATDVLVRTIDTGGAGPVSSLLEAKRMIEKENVPVVAVVAGDAVSSMSTEQFLARADQGCKDPDGELASPVIPNGYGRITNWHLGTYPQTTREQLAMVPVLMSFCARRNPWALGYSKPQMTLADVLASPPQASSINLFECARRTDGGAAFILASEDWMRKHNYRGPRVAVLGGAEASGPLYPPKILDERSFSCEEAVEMAYTNTGLSTKDIQFFGLYDCFPICFVRALEAVGLADKGRGGELVESFHDKLIQNGTLTAQDFPINTHGGLLGAGAPWEVPAMYNILEAFWQLSGRVGADRQIANCKRALVYGNGGIFSASAIALLEKC